MFTVRQAAEACGVSRQMIYQYRKFDSGFPRPVGKTGGAFLYTEADLRAWAKRQGYRWKPAAPAYLTG